MRLQQYCPFFLLLFLPKVIHRISARMNPFGNWLHRGHLMHSLNKGRLPRKHKFKMNICKQSEYFCNIKIKHHYNQTAFYVFLQSVGMIIHSNQVSCELIPHTTDRKPIWLGEVVHAGKQIDAVHAQVPCVVGIILRRRPPEAIAPNVVEMSSVVTVTSKKSRKTAATAHN